MLPNVNISIKSLRELVNLPFQPEDNLVGEGDIVDVYLTERHDWVCYRR